jgi:Protein of unknown function (DUF4232)
MRFRTFMAVAASAAAAGLTMAGSIPANASNSTAGKTRTCQASNLHYALGTKSGTMGQVTQVINLTNTSKSTCTMTGFPGVDLVGAANGHKNYTWPLVRQSVRYSKVTLARGKTAHFKLIYLIGTRGDGANISVHEIVITPPNTRSHAELTWNQSVLLQDAATHPGTFISPVMSGR